MKASARRNGYGPVESENERVGVIDAETPEAREDAHGMAALKKRKRGGKVEGRQPSHRMDRPYRAHGGRTAAKKGTVVNVIVAGQGGARPPGGMPPMPPPSGPVPPPVIAAPPRPMPPVGVPAGLPPGGPPPGMMPRKAGGRVHRASGGSASDWQNQMGGSSSNSQTSGKDDPDDQNAMGRRTGGRVGADHKYPKMDAGAMSGEGRLEKEEKYGRRAREGEGK